MNEKIKESLQWKEAYKWIGMLFDDEKYSGLSRESKLFYCILAGQKGQLDTHGEYIVYAPMRFGKMLDDTVENIKMCCAQLEEKGLIRYVPECAKIYVRTLEKNTMEGSGLDSVIAHVRKNIDYDLLLKQYEKGTLDELVALMADMIYVPRKTVSISGVTYPYAMIREKFLQINAEHVRYVLYCLQNSAGRIRKVRPYLIACLFNAPDTIHNFLYSEKNHLFD